MTHMLRAGASLVVAAVFLLALAPPASALGYSSNLIAGVVDIGTETIVIGAAPCAAAPQTMAYDITATSISVTGLQIEQVVEINGAWYHVEIAYDATLGAASGVYSAPPTRTVSDLEIPMVVTIDNAASGGSVCGSNGGAVLCTAATIVSVDSKYAGTMKAIGDIYYQMTGSDLTAGLQPWPTCNAGPFLAGDATTITNMAGIVV